MDMYSGQAFVVLIVLITVGGSLAVVLAIVLASLRARRQRADMLHKERMLALEKGLPVPDDYFEETRKRRPYVGGLVWAGVGLGFILWGVLGHEQDLNGIGMIPLLVGIGLFFGDWLTERRAKKLNNDSSAYPPADASRRASDNPS
jgi:hypothetical protein